MPATSLPACGVLRASSAAEMEHQVPQLDEENATESDQQETDAARIILRLAAGMNSHTTADSSRCSSLPQAPHHHGEDLRVGNVGIRQQEMGGIC